MHYLIEHETSIRFPKPIREHQCELRLAPREDDRQRLLSLKLEVDPGAELYSYQDAFGNKVTHLGLTTPHDFLVTRMQAEVETTLHNPFAFVPVPPHQERAWIAGCLRANPFVWGYVLHRSPMAPPLDRAAPDMAFPRYDERQSLLESVQGAMEWIASTLAYRNGATEVHHPLTQVLEEGAGVCQDFAHLLIAIVRGWGIPARYVSGYLDPGYLEDPAAPDAQATHAWAEVMIPGSGWLGFDPTHGLLANDTYVAAAVGRDSRDASPQRGSFKGDDTGEPPTVQLRVQRQQQQ